MAFFGWEKLKRITEQKPAPAKAAFDGNGPAIKCNKCGEIIIKVMLDQNLGVCPNCDYHTQISAQTRINVTLDEGSFIEHDGDLASVDVLNFSGGGKSYAEKYKSEVKKTGMLEAMLAGEGTLKTRRVAFGVTDSGFIAGSMGSVVGEKFTRLAEFALQERIPLIVFSGSGGGARMHEGMYSLMQMAKTSAALGKLREAGVPYISVVTDSTMGGIWASWAALGDLILAEPEALAGFTGPRVIKTTINAELPEGFQRSEYLLEHGQLDQIVHRKDMRDRLATLLTLVAGPAQTASA